MFNIPAPAFADQTKNGSQATMDNLSKAEEKIITNHLVAFELETADNNRELSEENKQIAEKSMENIDESLIYADIKDGEKNIILGTDSENTFVAITDDIIDVVEQIGPYDFLINGERHHFEVVISDGTDSNQGIPVSLASDNWTLISDRWVNVNAQRNFDTYTASTLGGILGAIIGSVFGLGFAGGIAMSAGVSIAYNYAASSKYPTNVGKSRLRTYKKGRSPLTTYKMVSQDYAVYKGKNVYLGTSTTIKRSCVGCGV